MLNIALIVTKIIVVAFGAFLSLAFFSLYRIRRYGCQSMFFTGLAVSMVTLLGFFSHAAPKNSKEVAMQARKRAKELR
ncbi:MAG: hypothetical protein WCT20_04510 [Candidatus Babeliales bacterium]|jgi:hypothetical protein